VIGLDYESLTGRLHTALQANPKVINPLSLLLLDESQPSLGVRSRVVEEKHPGHASTGLWVERSSEKISGCLYLRGLSRASGVLPVDGHPGKARPGGL